MSKKSTETPGKTQDMPTPVTPAATPAAAPAVPSTATAAAIVAAAPATPMTVAPQGTDPATALMVEQLPEYHRAGLLRLRRPTAEEFAATVKQVTPDQQEKLLDLMERMAPNKPGVHLSVEGFQPTLVKLFHGVGNDESRPAKLPPGNFYTTTSRDLTDKVTVAVLGFFDGRVLWPPKDAESNSPVCFSNDGVEGSKYGKCMTCPNSKVAYTKGGCTPQFTFWFIDQEMTGIYELSFSKTSYSAGKALAKILKDSKRPWNRWVGLESVPRVEGDKKWFVIKASPIQDPKVPANNDTTEALRAVLEQLNNSLELEAYYPRLVRQYSRAAEMGAGEAPAAGPGAGSELTRDTGDADFGGANTAL